MKRARIAQGYEHTVYRARFHPGTVLKTPRRITRVSRWLFGGVAGVRHEYQVAQAMVQSSAVKVAQTRIVATHEWGGYILIQEEVTEDHSIRDIYAYLKDQKQDQLATRYLTNPSNFISHAGSVYLIDFTKGIDIQFINKMHIMNEGEYRYLRRRMRQLVTSHLEWIKSLLA